MDFLTKIIDSRKITIGIFVLLILGILRVISLEVSLAETETKLANSQQDVKDLTDRLEEERRSAARLEQKHKAIEDKYDEAYEKLKQLESESPILGAIEVPESLEEIYNNLTDNEQVVEDEVSTPSENPSDSPSSIARDVLCGLRLAESHLCPDT